MSEEPEYVNPEWPEFDPEQHEEGKRCEYPYKGRDRLGQRCGLRAWKHAPKDDPRCVFHSRENPDDIKARLEDAVRDNVNLTEANLHGADLMDAELHGADLMDAELDGVILWEADLHGANLSGAKLHGADLSGAELHGANLTRAELHGADLSGAELHGADLSWAKLHEANLRRAELHGADLSEADLRMANLSWAELHGANLSYARLHGAYLGDAVLGRIGRHATGGRNDSETLSVDEWTKLHRAQLPDALLAGVVIPPELDLETATLDDVIRDENEAATADDYNECARVYRQLKLAFQDSGNYERAGKHFEREMRCRRQAMARTSGGWASRAFWYVFEKVAVYGEDPFRVALWAIGIVVAWAFLQGWFGVLGDAGQPVIQGIHWPSVDGFYAFCTALYFSVVTFTSLGYGDLSPSLGIGRLLAGTEAVIGLALMSLFLICVVRRFSR